MAEYKQISTSRTALKIGLPLALVMGFVFFFITFTAWNISILNWILVILGAVYSIQKHKSLQKQITFWEAFGVGSMTSAIAAVISGIMLLLSLFLYAIIYQNSRKVISPSQLFFQISVFHTLLGVVITLLYARVIQKYNNFD